MIDAGGPAPDFTLSDQDGKPVSLSSFRGRWVALYFSPKADTPGCTAQACGVRDHSADYEAANAVVLGISPDPVDELRFDDLRVWGNRRSTALIDPDGRIATVFPDVKPEEHDRLVLGALERFGAPVTEKA